jgi:hypothetical protein
MCRRLAIGLLAGIAVLAAANDARAQQTLNFSLGYFTPLGRDARVEDDVLTVNQTFLVFDIKDFNGATVGGEWLVPLGDYFEGGAGISFSRRTVPSVYQDFIDSDGTEIEQDLRLRLVPISFTFRVLPLGQTSAVQPYFGAGLNLINWRYSEFGEFADFGAGNPPPIFEDSFVASGSTVGPVALGGIRFGGDSATAGFEIRYHKAEADLDNRFAGRKLDLGGWTYNFTVGVRFGR